MTILLLKKQKRFTTDTQRRALKIPNPKYQIPNHPQNQKFKIPNLPTWRFGKLDIGIYLDFVIWNLAF
jgi:hypothetical protein